MNRMLLSLYNLDSTPNEAPVCNLLKGEHIIGRGNLLKCNDKRVSRNHAIITIGDNSISITSTHQNPCFYQSASSNTVIILPKDAPFDINDADKFGLFPDQFWFKCYIKVGSFPENTKVNTIVQDEANSAENCTKEMNKMTNMTRQNNTDFCNSQQEMDFSVCSRSETERSSNKRHCVYAANASEMKIPKLDVDCISEDNENKKCFENKECNDIQDLKNVNEINNFGICNQIDINKIECANDILPDVKYESENIINAEDENIEFENKHKETIGVDDQIVQLNKADISDEISYAKGENDQPEKILEETIDTDKEDVTQNILDPQDDTNSNQASSSSNVMNGNDTKMRRDRCWYGTKCYRKNLQHKKEYSHLGDSDYDSDPIDKRPICPYGQSCYRKNKDHRKQYKHPCNRKKTANGKRRTTKAKYNEQNSESSLDDYDYDDPFLDDDSADEYQEESWSDDSEDDFDNAQDISDEDTKGLVKEAKRFTKK